MTRPTTDPWRNSPLVKRQTARIFAMLDDEAHVVLGHLYPYRFDDRHAFDHALGRLIETGVLEIIVYRGVIAVARKQQGGEV